jgi:small-conductance mechanosensitive channel
MGQHTTSYKLAFALITEVAFAALSFLAPSHAEAQNAAVSKPSNSEAAVTFWNRVITHQRGILAGATPEERSEHASKRLAELPLNTSPDEIVTRAVKIEDQDGIGFGYRGRLLFFLGTNDLDKESGETLEEASESALRNLREALQARSAERSWPVIRVGLLYTFVGFVLLVLLCVALWKTQAAVVGFLLKKENFFSLNVFRVDLVPHVAAAFYGLLRLFSWMVTFSLIYLWVTLSLRRFPYTEPWGKQAGGYVLQALREVGITIVESLPGLLMVFLIYVFTRWLVRMANVLFDQVATGRISVSWMDADVAHATQRIFSAILWIFAIIIAYPYIPGSHTEAFKGLSVFFGLVISLGSTGIINQVMSGLFVVYSKALKAGEWVRINETEGEVREVGLLAAKICTMEGKEVTIPNSVLVGTSTMNFTRLGHPDGMIVSSTVTIGYDAPWRQVHALLELAADRTENLRKSPKPYVLQRQLSDFYVEYTLVARLEEERLRIETVSHLHSAIQDSFNEFGVQIMSPHYMLQPSASIIVPREKWHSPPSTHTVGSSRMRNDPDTSEPRK